MKRRSFLTRVAAVLAIPFFGVKSAKALPWKRIAAEWEEYRKPEHTFYIEAGAGPQIVVKFFNSYIMRVYLDGVCMEDNLPSIDGKARIYCGGSEKWYGAIKCKRTGKDTLSVYWFAVSTSRKGVEEIARKAWDNDNNPPKEVYFRGIPIKFIKSWDELPLLSLKDAKS